MSVVRKILQTNPSVGKTKQSRLMLLSNYTVSGKKKLPLIKNQGLHNFKNI